MRESDPDRPSSREASEGRRPHPRYCESCGVRPAPVSRMSLRLPPWRLLSAIALVAWAGLATPALADRLQEIRDRGQVIVGVKEDYAPFGFRDAEGTLAGYDVDVARAFAEAIGVGLELVPVTSANRLQKVQRGEIDIVAATMGDTRSRRELVTMIEPQYYGDGANVLLRG